MLIAIEGCDGAGKTTLIEQLRKNSQRYFLIVRSAGYPKSLTTRRNYVHAIHQLKEVMHPEWVVLDRVIAISESIYGPICRNTPRWNHSDIGVELEPVDVVVYCRPPTGSIQGGALVHPQMAGVTERLLDIVDAYDRTMDYIERFMSQRVIRYDYTSQNADWVAERLRR